MARLIFRNAEDASTVHELNDGTTTIGRAVDNTLVISDSSVSGRHAKIIGAGGSYVLQDLNSANGTNVNGCPVSESTLKQDDIVDFGAVEVVFINDSDPQDVNASTHNCSTEADKANVERSWSKLSNFGTAAFAETKRNANLAVLKTKIEKLKYIDLANAYFKLGRRAYELPVDADKFQSEYKEIAELQKDITIKRKGDVGDPNALTFEKIISIGKSAKMATQAEALELKVKQRFVVLGRKIEDVGTNLGLTSERDDIYAIKARIEKLEAEYTATSSDHLARHELATHLLHFRSGAKAFLHHLSIATYGALLSTRRRRVMMIMVVLVLCGFGVLIIHTSRHVPFYSQTLTLSKEDEAKVASNIPIRSNGESKAKLEPSRRFPDENNPLNFTVYDIRRQYIETEKPREMSDQPGWWIYKGERNGIQTIFWVTHEEVYSVQIENTQRGNRYISRQELEDILIPYSNGGSWMYMGVGALDMIRDWERSDQEAWCEAFVDKENEFTEIVVETKAYNRIMNKMIKR